MAKLRRWRAYRSIERAYTRISKFRNKSFIRMTPNIKITRFVMGDTNKDYPESVDLIPKTSLQIRQESIESGRLTAVRLLEKSIGKGGYTFRIRKFPYQIQRENPLASGAGADRMSTGMKKSFGKPIGIAVQIRAGEKLMTIATNPNNIDVAQKALHRAARKMPCSFYVRVNAHKPQVL